MVVLLSAVCSIFMPFIFHFIFLRGTFGLVRKYFPSQLIALLSGLLSIGICTGTVFFFASDDIAYKAFYIFIVSGGFSYFYFHTFNMSETARRIHLLQKIISQNGKVEIKEMEKDYNETAIVKVRLKRLLDTKQIELRDNGRFYPKGKLLSVISKIINAYRRILFPDFESILKREIKI